MPYKDREKAKEYWKFYHSQPERKKQKRENQRKNYHENIKLSRIEARKRGRKYRIKYRLLVLIHYGGDPPKCACCGENHLEFLSIDHIHGGGDEERKKIGGSRSCGSMVFYRWLIKNGFPDGYQVLCYNCNCAKGFYGYCPHQMNE